MRNSGVISTSRSRSRTAETDGKTRKGLSTSVELVSFESVISAGGCRAEMTRGSAMHSPVGLVGERGFEPPTSASRTLRANRAALLPEADWRIAQNDLVVRAVDQISILAVPEEGLEPPTPALGRRRSIH